MEKIITYAVDGKYFTQRNACFAEQISNNTKPDT